LASDLSQPPAFGLALGAATAAFGSLEPRNRTLEPGNRFVELAHRAI